MFVTFDNNLPCHCEPFPSLSLRAKRGNPIGSPPRLLRPDKSGLATTEGGYTEIAEPVLKRKQGISLLATTEGGYTEIAEPVLKRKQGISLLATTEGGHTEVAEPVPKRKQGISLLATTEKSVTKVLNRDTY